MFTSKQNILSEITTVLNKDDQPWEIAVEGEKIICRWKWQDTRFFSLVSVTDQQKEYTLTITLKDNGKWSEVDSIATKSSQINAGGFSTNKTHFKGTTNTKSFEIGFGKNKQTGDTGVVKVQFDTSLIKRQVREYLTQNGWKKAGLLG